MMRENRGNESTLYSTNRMEAALESQSKTMLPEFASPRHRRCPLCLALAAGLALRLWMLKQFFQVNGDSLIYGGLAKNLLLHGRYALTGPAASCIRR